MNGVLQGLNNIHVIHVGKCGGGAFNASLRRAGISYTQTHTIPINNKNGLNFDEHYNTSKFIILLRNPVTRFTSSFYWTKNCYKNISDITNKPADYDRHIMTSTILNVFNSPNILAEFLRKDGVNQIDFQSASSYVEHFTEDINWYLTRIKHVLTPENVLGVLTVEDLKNDSKRLFGIDIVNRPIHSVCYEDFKGYSKSEEANIRDYFIKDYEWILSLYDKGMINKTQYNNLIR